MHGRLVLAAALGSLLSGSAGAQIRLDLPAAQPSSADVLSADAAPVALTPVAPAPGAAGLRASGSRVGGTRGAGTGTIKPQAVRWIRRPKVRIQPPVRAQDIFHLTLPVFDMAAPLTQGGGKLTLDPQDSGPMQGSMPLGTAFAPAAEPAQATAPVTAVQAEALSPAAGRGPTAAKPQLPIADTARQALDAAEPAPTGTRATPAYTWIEPVAGTAAPTILLKTGPEVGLAAFRAGPEIFVVLDAPIDFRAPAIGLDPAFAQLNSRRTEDATLIRIPMASGTLSLARSARGWIVAVGSPPSTVAPIVPRLVKSGPVTTSIQFPASAPTRVVTVVNPETGQRLLVGTQGATGQAISNPWQQAKFDLMPTLQGVVVAAISDDMRLRASVDGFTLSTGPQGDSPIMQDADRQDSNAPIAGAMSRLFDIPNGSAAELAQELDQRIRAASGAHALARSEPRLRVAEAMLALGMDVEAQSVIDVAAAADPALMDTPRAIGLRAVASLLAGRFDDAGTLADARLNGSTEIELWRGLLQAAKDTATANDARSLADGLPLVLAYPQTLRDRLLPITLETMALYGQESAAQAVLKTLPDDRTLDLARALVLEMTNQTEAALREYDRVANSSDRLRRYKAEVRVTELRIKGGQLDARAGADVLDRAVLGWRDARQELALRTRIAALRRQAGQWREALTVLRDGRDAFPEDHAQIDRELAATFTAFIGDDSTRELPPSEFVALYDQNADLVRDISWTEQTGMGLVDRLIGLGLQGRAEPVMTRLVAQSTDPVERARLGARLADLRMTLNDPAGAIAALADTAPPAGMALDPAMMEARQLLYAHAESERGNKDAALAMLGTLGTAKADAARADIYTARKDWPATVTALTAWERKAISSSDLTDRQQDMVMRLAVAATLSADTATLERVAGSYGSAMAKGRSAAFFRLLTSAPVRDKDDLPRAFEEIQLARQVAGNLGATENP
jgi:hypothetical protein